MLAAAGGKLHQIRIERISSTIAVVPVWHKTLFTCQEKTPFYFSKLSLLLSSSFDMQNFGISFSARAKLMLLYRKEGVSARVTHTCLPVTIMHDGNYLNSCLMY